MSEWRPEDWQLRSELPDVLDLCHEPNPKGLPGEVIWHKQSCGETNWGRGESTWVRGIPVSVAVQMWPTATGTSPVGYCQLCLIEKV